MLTNFLKNEKWWGGICSHVTFMPFTEKTEYSVDLRQAASNNQVSYLFVSDKGRYIFSRKAFGISFTNGKIETDEEVETGRIGDTLQSVVDGVHQKYMSEKVDHRCAEYALTPQYCTWIDMMYEQTQAGVLKYAKSVLRNKLPAGVLIIDCGWQKYYGNWEFDRTRFPNPEKMIKKLHAMGFKVMLWMVPYVSADSKIFRELKGAGYLLKKENGEILCVKWWDGYSAVIDFLNPEASAWFKRQADRLSLEYGVDGIKLDGGDLYSYNYEGKTDAVLQCEAFSSFGASLKLCEMRICYNGGGENMFFRVADKAHSWDLNGLKAFLPVMIMQGLMGYYYSCADMIGGGECGNFLECINRLDEELFIRHCQLACLNPLMQFSYPVWNSKYTATKRAVKACCDRRRELSPFLRKAYEEAESQGKPVLRSMKYQFDADTEEESQFMIGDRLLVAPVLDKGATEKKVFLPEGKWKFGEKTFDGGCYVTVPAPLDVLPYFIRL